MLTRIPTDDSTATHLLLAAAAEGDEASLSALVERHHDWLLRFAATRIDPRLRSRADAFDIVQETEAVVCTRLADFLRRRPVSFRAWLLKTAYDQLGKLKRRHIVAERRSVLHEIHLDDDSSYQLATQFVAPQSHPWQQMSRAELAEQMRRALAQLSEQDREVLLLRQFEGLENQEIGYLLDLSPQAVSKRHGRALRHLHAALLAQGLDESNL